MKGPRTAGVRPRWWMAPRLVVLVSRREDYSAAWWDADWWLLLRGDVLWWLIERGWWRVDVEGGFLWEQGHPALPPRLAATLAHLRRCWQLGGR